MQIGFSILAWKFNVLTVVQKLEISIFQLIFLYFASNSSRRFFRHMFSSYGSSFDRKGNIITFYCINILSFSALLASTRRTSCSLVVVTYDVPGFQRPLSNYQTRRNVRAYFKRFQDFHQLFVHWHEILIPWLFIFGNPLHSKAWLKAATNNLAWLSLPPADIFSDFEATYKLLLSFFAIRCLQRFEFGLQVLGPVFAQFSLTSCWGRAS